MTPENRRQSIVSAVMQDGSLSIEDLATRFEVSRMTVHRDLDLLEKQGLLRKERGLATAESTLVYESNFHFRSQVGREDKQALCSAAAALVGPGNVVMIDESTTTLPLVDALVAMDLEDLTIVTNSVSVEERVRQYPGIRLIGTGGFYDANQRAYYGLIGEQALGTLRADWVFLSSSSVIGTSLYHQDQQVIRIKRAFMSAAENRALLLTANKFSVRALNRYAELSDFTNVFIRGSLDEDTVTRLQNNGIPFEFV